MIGAADTRVDRGRKASFYRFQDNRRRGAGAGFARTKRRRYPVPAGVTSDIGWFGGSFGRLSFAGDPLDRVDDGLVTRAAAVIARNELADLFARRRRILRQQFLRR